MFQRAAPLNVYLAARYSRREEMVEVERKLVAVNPHFTVVSRWIGGSHQIDDAGLSLEAKQEERERFAWEDMCDLRRADWLIFFSETPRSSNSRGGRHVEFGVALERGLRVFVVGPRENVFHCLAAVTLYPSIEALIDNETDRWAQGGLVMDTCPIPSCRNQKQEYMVMCRTHWQMVPEDVRRAVWYEYRHRRGSPEHRGAIREAITSVLGVCG